MASPAAQLRHLLASGRIWHSDSTTPVAPATWGFAAVAGQLVELGGEGASAAWTAATSLVLDAQIQGEPTSWITRPDAFFFPPDVADHGVDLHNLTVVQVPNAVAQLRAADCLLRAGAFGLVVLDFGESADIPLSAQVRLAGLAKKHEAGLVCLAQRFGTRGSFASLRAVSTRRRVSDGRFSCGLHMVKDKRRAGDWESAQVLRGPMGLC